MNYDEAFLKFKEQYSSHPRVMKIMMEQFGGDEFCVLYHDKHDTSSPISVTSYEGFPDYFRSISQQIAEYEIGLL